MNQIAEIIFGKETKQDLSILKSFESLSDYKEVFDKIIKSNDINEILKIMIDNGRSGYIYPILNFINSKKKRSLQKIRSAAKFFFFQGFINQFANIGEYSTHFNYLENKLKSMHKSIPDLQNKRKELENYKKIQILLNEKNILKSVTTDILEVDNQIENEQLISKVYQILEKEIPSEIDLNDKIRLISIFKYKGKDLFEFISLVTSKEVQRLFEVAMEMEDKFDDEYIRYLYLEWYYFNKDFEISAMSNLINLTLKSEYQTNKILPKK